MSHESSDKPKQPLASRSSSSDEIDENLKAAAEMAFSPIAGIDGLHLGG